MRTNNMIKNIKKLLSAAALPFFLFTSCEVGLGKAVDIKAPVITVNSPERTGYILKTFSITGKAEDNIEIDRLELLIEPLDNPTEQNSYKFRIVNKKWERFDYSSKEWNEYENEYTSVSGSKTKLDWKLAVTFPDSVVTGTEFNITSQVYDCFNNESPNSKDERSVTVDMNSPNVSIIQPALRAYSAENNASYSLKDNSVIENLMNGKFTVKGSQKEDGRLSSLFIYLDEKTSASITDVEKEPGVLKNNSIAWKEVNGDNIRNWSADFNLSTISGYEHNRKTVRLVTESHDQAGNVEYVVQGWFTYWNDADIPWINATFGGDNASDRIAVYPSSALQGQCYDDDGLKKITVKVYQYQDTTKKLYKTDTYDAGNVLGDKPKYYAWSVNALGGVCNFDVEVECEDINGKKASTVTRYLHVKDTNPPVIKIKDDTTRSLIDVADASGNFTLNGYVEDDGGVASLKIVRISENTPDTELIKYYDKTYAQWNKVSSSNKNATDANGNKMFWVELGNASGANNRRTFAKTFNIFSHFGINGSTEKLITQQFVIMAVDIGGEAKIDSFSYAGDSDGPTLTIDKLVVYKSDNSEKETLNFATAVSKKLKPYNRNSSNAITDKIQISGSWSDNSTNKWSDKTKHGNLTLNIDGIGNVSVTVNNNGTWTTGKITPADSTTAVIYAEFSDYAGNVKKVNDNFFVSSNLPELLRISSTINDNPSVKSGDGSYKAGEEVIVALEFNKAVKYTGGNPTLTLNVPASGTKKTIACISPANKETSTYEFKYTVAAGDDIDKLDVTAVNANGSVWTDTDGAAANLSLPSAANRLSGTRSIKIDTKAPSIKTISAITSQGSYKAGDSIFMKIEFDEDVEIDETKLSNLKLSLNAASDPTLSAKVTGSKTVLMTYTIGSNNNASPLKVTGVTFTNAGITDIAGNAITTGTSTATLTGIIIDTGVPGKPTITGFDNNAYVYDSNGVSFTVTDIASDATVKQYSIDNGATWTNYTGAVNLRNNGTFTVTAKVRDAAGNESPVAVAKTVTIDAGNLLTSVSAELPTGTYTTGDVIPVVLNFRRNVKVASGSTLTLNNSKTASIRTAYVNTSSAKLIYDYTVAEGDDINALDVSTIAGTFTDAAGHNVNSYIIGKIPTGKNLADGRTLKIITGKPVVQSAALSTSGGNDVLTITFSRSIKKGSGNITLTHGDGYKAPGVISEETFINYKAKSSSLTTYYTLGTNGSDANGNSDLTEKYVLNYDKDTNDTAVVAALKTADADKVIIPVNSSKVTVNDNKLVITLNESYAIPVKGASYSVSVAAGVAKDNQNHSNELSNSLSVSHKGLEAPVVRVNKKRETTGATVTQPLQTGVKADCQTPGSSVTCVIYSQTIAKETISAKDTKSTKKALSLTKGDTKTTYPFNIGATDINNGYIYRINATAKKSGATDVTAYEFAYRSVYTLTNVPAGDVGGENDYKQLWVRGSDLPNGGVSISSYPVSWDTADFNKVRAMTNSTGTTWYWVSWEINKAAHLQPLRGDMPSDAGTNGPSVWCWGMQSYVPGIPKGLTPLYPGHSLAFNASSQFYYGGMSFYNKHCEYRDGTKVIKKKKGT